MIIIIMIIISGDHHEVEHDEHADEDADDGVVVERADPGTRLDPGRPVHFAQVEEVLDICDELVCRHARGHYLR